MYICIVFKTFIYTLFCWKILCSANPNKASSSNDKKPIELNIKSQTKSNDKINFTKNDKLVTYSVKGNFGFKSVKDDKIEIWKSTNEYATKVTNEDGNKVTIYMGDNTTKMFNKGSGGKWTECEPETTNNEQNNSESGRQSTQEESNAKKHKDNRKKLHPSAHPQEITIIIEGTTPNDTSKYKVKKDFDEYDYIIKKGNQCIGVQYNGTTVWKSGNYNITEAKSISYNPDDTQIVVRDKKNLVSFHTDDEGNWKKFFTLELSEEATSEQSSSEDEDEYDDEPIVVAPKPKTQPQPKPVATEPSTSQVAEEPQIISHPASPIHNTLCQLLCAENIYSDLSNGLNTGLKLVHMPMWIESLKTIDFTIPIILRTLNAFFYENNIWTHQFIEDIDLTFN